MEQARFGDRRLAYELSGGSGDPVVLVHGGWDDHHVWDLVVPGLAEALQVVAYDRRGHGESSGPPQERPVRSDAEDLAGLLESTGQFPAHLVAQGYAGAVVLRLAVDRPELVRSIAVHEATFVGLVDREPPESAEGPTLAELLPSVRELVSRGSAESAARRYLELFASPEERWEEAGESWRQTLVANAAAWAEEVGDPEAQRPVREELAGIPVPVLVTTGGRSPRFAARIGELLASAMPNATALWLPDGGHFVARTDPDLFVGVLGSFLLERNVPST